jgi:exosortase
LVAGSERPGRSKRAAWHLDKNTALHLIGAVGLAFAFSSLLTLGTQYGFARGVEYWLFRPTDNTPLVVVVLSAWLAYRRLPRVRALPMHTGPWGLIVGALVAAQCVFAWAVYTGAADLHAFALMLTAVGLIVANWGTAGLRVLWLPVVFLAFAVPMPAPFLLSVVFKLQIWTAHYAGWILYAIGEPALVSGDQILRVSQSFQVIEGCSGLRSLETLSMLTVLLVDLFRRSGWHAAILVVSAPLIAFALNGFRVVTLILNPYSEIIAIHNLQGIVILLAGLLTVYFIDGVLERYPLQMARAAKPSGEGARYAPKAAVGVLLATAGLSSLILVGLPAWEDPGDQRFDLVEQVTTALEEWPSQKIKPDFIFRGSARFGQIIERRFEIDEGFVDVFAASADLGERGGSSRSPVTAVPGSGWLVRETHSVTLGETHREASERIVEKGRQRLLVRHFYDGDRGFWSETTRTLLAIDRSPARRTRPLLAIRLASPIYDRSKAALEASRNRLDRVYVRLEPALQRFIEGSRE